MSLKTIKQEAIKLCIQAREKAILIPTSHTKVGAVLYGYTKVKNFNGKLVTYGHYWEGYNIQNRSHKSYHAEEMAILNYLTDTNGGGGKKNTFATPKGLIVSFTGQIAKITFCCGHCRQTLWEYTMNPDLLITEVDLEGNIIKEKTLKELYPDPYPR